MWKLAVIDVRLLRKIAVVGIVEAYSAAGKTWFGWWLVEHYLSYHVKLPGWLWIGGAYKG